VKFRTPTARLSGRVRWTILDENDQPTYALNQRGERVWGGHWNSNLITDAGLDAVATDYLRTYPGALNPIEQTWRAYGHIGTGSTAPANGDTVLDAEVMTSNSNGGFSDSETFNSPSGGFITADFQITRVFILASSQTLAEYGFSDDKGSLHIRELFRDESDSPITISIAGGKKLRLDHTLTVALPWGAASEAFDIEEYDASDTLTATHSMTADCTFFATSSSRYSQLFYCALPRLGGLAAKKYISVHTSAQSSDPTVAASALGSYNVTNDSYTPGSFMQRVYAELGEPDSNGDLYGYALRTLNNGSDHGFKVIFTSPTSFTKANTHTLELSVELSWARA